MTPALVTAGGLPRQHRRDQAPRERHGRLHLVRTDGFREDHRADQHIAGNREGPAYLMAAPVDAGGARVSREATVPVHDMELAVVPAFVGRGELGNNVLRAHASF